MQRVYRAVESDTEAPRRPQTERPRAEAAELVEARALLCELRERVRVETVAWFERDALGARPAPVLFDGTAVVELGRRAADYADRLERARVASWRESLAQQRLRMTAEGQRDAATADAGRLRAALRRFADVFHECDVCGVCGGAWDDDGRKHFDGCAVGAALTEADR